jgi:nifR3 family TIM-barrel protein
MAGGALLQNMELTQKIFKTLVSSVKKPVSLKMRVGVNDQFLFKDIAKMAQREGVKMITLHARTVQQGYSGKSDWTLIKELKEIVDIPIVGNGDVTSPELAKAMIDETGCDYVMVGRGAMGNPFLFRQINDYLESGKYQKYSAKYRIEMFLKYTDFAINYNIKFSNIRQQAMNFTKGIMHATKLRPQIMLAKTVDDLKSIIIEASY